MERNNKALRLEFRKHQGTIDPNEIGFWVKFCGRLIRLAHYFCKQIGDELRDKGGGNLEDTGFLETLVENNHILDLLAFEEEEKNLIPKLEKKHWNVASYKLRGAE